MGYERPPYYLTAYGIAVKHGYEGTEEEWINDIRGDAAESAAAAAESAAEAAGAAEEAAASVVGTLTDALGSVYPSAGEARSNLEQATAAPRYRYYLETTPATLGGNDIVRRQKSQTVYIGANKHLMIRVSETLADLIANSGWLCAFVRYDMTGGTASASYTLYIEGRSLCDYSYFHPSSPAFAVYVQSPEGTVNTLDLNDHVFVYATSPYYGRALYPRFVSPAPAPYVRSGDEIVKFASEYADPDTESGDNDGEETDTQTEPSEVGINITNQICGVEMDARDLRCVWSDAVAFDYAVTAADGTILKDFETDLTGALSVPDSYTESLAVLPETYDGGKPARIYLNLTVRSRSGFARGYDIKRWLQEHVFPIYEGESHEPARTYAASVALENVRTLLAVNPYVGSARNIIRRRATSLPLRTGAYYPGALYRPVLRNNLGPCVSYRTYLSCLDGYLSMATVNHAVSDGYYDESGYYGLVCASFIANVLGSRLFLSTTTAWRHYGPDGLNVMTPLTDLSTCDVGDIVYWDGSTTVTTSNHIAVVVDKVYVHGALRYVVVAEAGSTGLVHTWYEAPFNPGRSGDSRPAYRLKCGDLGFVPPRLTETDVWGTGDNEVLSAGTGTYMSPVALNGTLPSVLTMRSSWGDRHNTRAGNEQRVVFARTAAGTPYDTLTLSRKEGDAYTEVRSWTLEEILADQDANPVKSPATAAAWFDGSYLLSGIPDGWYRLTASGSGAEDAVCDLYYYTHRISMTAGTADLTAIIAEFGTANVLVRRRVPDPAGSVRTVAQYAWLPLQDYIDAGTCVGGVLTPAYDGGALLDRGLLCFNEYGAAEYVFTEESP